MISWLLDIHVFLLFSQCTAAVEVNLFLSCSWYLKFEEMSFMKGDLLTKTRRLVKGLAKAEPLWLKAMEQYVNLLLHDYVP